MIIISRAASLCAATRQRLAVSALAGSAPVTRLAREFGTSRKFVGVVRDKAQQAAGTGNACAASSSPGWPPILATLKAIPH